MRHHGAKLCFHFRTDEIFWCFFKMTQSHLTSTSQLMYKTQEKNRESPKFSILFWGKKQINLHRVQDSSHENIWNGLILLGDFLISPLWYLSEISGENKVKQSLVFSFNWLDQDWTFMSGTTKRNLKFSIEKYLVVVPGIQNYLHGAFFQFPFSFLIHCVHFSRGFSAFPLLLLEWKGGFLREITFCTKFCRCKIPRN